jgi:hypothetical protein
LKLLSARGLQLLSPRSLDLLAAGCLKLLGTRSLKLLSARGLQLLAAGRLQLLTPGGLQLLAPRGLQLLAPRGLQLLTPRGLQLLTPRGLQLLAPRGLQGPSLPLAGEPREIAGHTRDRYVYAPCDGVFRTKARIGDIVGRGQEIAEIGSIVLTAPLGEMLRGLTHDGVPVTDRTKVIEIDPRHAGSAQVSGIGERPAKVAEGVSAAISAWEASRNSAS